MKSTIHLILNSDLVSTTNSFGKTSHSLAVKCCVFQSVICSPLSDAKLVAYSRILEGFFYKLPAAAWREKNVEEASENNPKQFSCGP